MIENGAQVCVLATGNRAHGDWLSGAAEPRLAVETSIMEPAALAQRIAMLSPAMAVIDFSADVQKATELVQSLRTQHPDLALIGLGSMSEPSAMLGALRAGVHDFIDMQAAPAEAVKVMRAASARREAGAGVQGRVAVLLGARAGLGVTTLACNLSLLLRRSLLAQKAAADVTLLDLGMPCADSLLYLDARGDFTFVDAVRNLKRIDQTLAYTAFTRHPEGIRLLPLPANLSLMREISHVDSVALVRKLRGLFAAQVADLGGFSNTDFMVQLLRPADTGSDPQRVWVVCDQGLGGIVSTARMLTELQERGVETGAFGLVVNRFDAAVGMPARDIAQRLGLPLEAAIPNRGTQLLKAAGHGKALAEMVSSDPYLDAVGGMARALLAPEGAAGAPAESSWLQRAAQLVGGRKG
ncbi:MAG: histidine kinase [Comamonadaceae bacterium]|nr:MAG: histidine kinase [Comamonadaceae bacterium]